jgi:hypothetical protein
MGSNLQESDLSCRGSIASVSLLEEFSNEKNAVKKTARKLAFSSTV